MYKISKLLLILFILPLVQFSCNSSVEETKAENSLKEGIWKATMFFYDTEIPFQFELTYVNDNPLLVIKNGDERITVDEVSITNDSIEVIMPVFNTGIKGVFTSDRIDGKYYNYDRDNYSIDFLAEHGKDRFDKSTNEAESFDGKWEVTFSPEESDKPNAIGVFNKIGEKYTGTFMTETGDYRFLEGIADGDRLRLSCFDGSHLFLFLGYLSGDSIIDGTFWSGNHWNEPWVAKRNKNFELSDPYELTFINEGYDKIEFTFPDLDSNLVSLDDKKYQDKTILVQILGSWCPNCMDETKYYAKLHQQYQKNGFEIIGLAYERPKEFSISVNNVKRLKKSYDVKYEILIAGPASKKSAAESLPMLNHVLSFPTSILIDKNGEIKSIHTGFTGPATGKYYDDFKKQMEAEIEKLLKI